jgi:hypothetical protein
MSNKINSPLLKIQDILLMKEIVLYKKSFLLDNTILDQKQQQPLIYNQTEKLSSTD